MHTAPVGHLQDNRAKQKKGCYLLLERTLEGGLLEAVCKFRDDPAVLSTFKENATFPGAGIVPALASSRHD